MSGDQSKTTGSDLIRTVTGSELTDVVIDVADIGLDTILDQGVLEHLPVVGSIVKVYRAGGAIAEEILIRKVLRFLRELQSVPMAERQRFLQKYPDGTSGQQKLGENLLLAIERLDDVEKPIVLARFLAAYMKEQIDYVTFTRLARALERFNLSLLPHLRRFYLGTEEKVETLTEELQHELSIAGLITVSLAGSGAIGGSAHYAHAELGIAFLRYGFGLSRISPAP